MKRSLATLLVLLALSSASTWAQSSEDTELLQALDDARFFDETVTTLSIRIVSETPDEVREATLRLRFYDSEAGSFARIEFETPEELAGQIFLSTPDATYFYGPDLDFPIKTSATAEVFGDAAVAQTSGIRFADSYTIEARRDVTTEDGDLLWEIDLAAVDFTVAFQLVTVTVDPESLQPLSAILYAVSGIPFYEVFYEEYVTTEEGDTYVRSQRIVNQLLLGRVTTSAILDLSSGENPPELFDPVELGAGSPS
ncbi:outer membrane lipoprotein-sorting protein [Candidatus Bipolaricaulota bacterium]